MQIYIPIFSHYFGPIFHDAALARFEARLALDAGDFAHAADRYQTAERRLGNHFEAPFGTQCLDPSALRFCKAAAYFAAREEGQKLKRQVQLPETLHYERFTLGALLGVRFSDMTYFEERTTLLTRREQLLLFLHRPLAVRPSLLDFAKADRNRRRDERGISHFFMARYRAAKAEAGDAEAMVGLMWMAVHSDYALRALEVLAQRAVPGAVLAMIRVRAERHSIFKARQERERRRLEEEIQNIRFML